MNNIMELLDGGLRVAVLLCAVRPGFPEPKSAFYRERYSVFYIEF
jgi:hypothetical protein